ncbi:MAG: hypothetical protein N2C14_11800 [Planctomycetales bacterium]
MDVFNHLRRQAMEKLLALPPAARVAALAAVFLSAGGLGLFFNLPSVAPEIALFGGREFSEEELFRIQAALAGRGLSSFSIEGRSVCVPRNRQAQYVEALVKADALPLDAADQVEDQLSGWGALADPQTKRHIILVAKQNRLARIMQRMPDVEQAWVVLDSEPKGGLRGGDVRTASVSIRPREAQPLDPRRVAQIRELVTRSVAGLESSKVAVIDLHDASGTAAANSSDDPYLRRVKEYQAHYQALISKCLAHIPGAVIAVDVELDKNVRQVRSASTIEPRSQAMSGGTAAPLLSSIESMLGGRKRLDSVQGNRPVSLNQGSPRPRFPAERRRTDDLVARETIHVEETGMTPVRVAVSVSVPRTYYRELLQQRSAESSREAAWKPTTDELQQIEQTETEGIRQSVSAVIPRGMGFEGAVTVTSFEPLRPISPEAPLLPSTRDSDWLAQQPVAWGLSVGLAVLSAGSLIVLARSRRSRPKVQQSNDAATTARSAPAEQQADERADPPENALREHLGELVRKDPASAADTLRDWIGSNS